MANLQVNLISCWYKEKSCGRFAYNLARALEKLGVKITVISANCLCFREDPFNPKLFFSPCKRIKFADFYWKPAPKIINYFRSVGQLTGDALKGYKYLQKINSPLLHYQQIQGSFGFLPLLSLLSCPTKAKRIITVHEIDIIQKQFKFRSKAFSTIKLNKIYNKADAVIVQNTAMKNVLENLGVSSKKIHVIPHGTHIPKLKTYYRDQIIFCGGHHLTSGKGFDIFLKALLILNRQNIKPKVTIYGLNPEYDQEKGKKLISKLGIHNQIKWFDYKTDDALLEEFQRSMFMVTPYTTSEAGAAVTTAMANAVPVIATRNVGLPEYLGDDGIYINENDPKYLADKMAQLINNNALRQTLSIRLYNRAVKFYSWEVIAQKTLELYKKVLS